MPIFPTISLRIVVVLSLLLAVNAICAETSGSIQHYDKAMLALKSAKTPYERWCFLGAAAKESFNRGEDADAKSLAEELERLVPTYKSDWNYGNAIQDSNLVLGRLALKFGDVEKARSRLLAAGHSPGSPQMDSFGPNMSLADDLLKIGETPVVLEYFALCRKFWKVPFSKLDDWEKDVKAGRAPDFGANLVY